MAEATIGASNARMLDIAENIKRTFSQPGEHELRLDAEDVQGNWFELIFNSEDTSREDWDDGDVVVEVYGV